MANTVSFIIRLQDKYSAAAAKISKATDKMNRKMGGLKKKVNEIQKSFTSFGKKAVKTGAVMTAALTVPIGLLAKSMVDAASDAKETSDKFDAVFSDIRGKARITATEFADRFKLANSTAQDMLGTTGDLLVGFGFADDKALGLSTTINKLALDLAAFQNLEGGAPRASKALTSALSGETEGLKALGIVVNQNDPLFKQMFKQNLRLTRGNIVQAKALTILTTAQNQTTKANDNYLDTLDTLAGLQRVQTEANKKMSESFGKLLLPFAIKLTTALTMLANWVNKLSPGMKRMVLVLGGLLAIAGPLIIALGAIGLAVGFISLPLLIIVATIAAAVAAFLWLQSNWISVSDAIGGTIEQIGINFSLLWDDVKAGFQSFIDFIQPALDILLAPVRAVAALGGFIGGKIAGFAAPSAPVGGGGSINGEITVSATQGAKVENTKLQSRGAGLNVGMNVAGAL